MTARAAAVPWVLLPLLSLAGCAGAPGSPPVPVAPSPVAQPAAEPQPVPAPPPAPPAEPLSRLVCTVQQARRIDFSELGVPAGHRPIDLALGKGTVWVLFAPSLLVGIPRRIAAREPAAVAELGEVEEVAIVPAPGPDAWRSLAVDWDGTLWLASPSGLWRMRPGRRAEAVIAAKSSGFRDVAVGRGAVWVAPVCSADAVWKLDARGKVLGTALPLPAGSSGRCAAVDLERDWSGDVWALRPASGETFRLAFDGSWKPAGDTLAVPLPPDGGELLSWFFWGTEALALGGTAEDPHLLRQVDGKVAAFHEDCGDGNSLVRVAGDSRGWAALTGAWLLLGEHQRPAPAGTGSH